MVNSMRIMESKKKVAILQRIVYRYQAESLIRLHDQLADMGVSLKIFCGIVEGGATFPGGMFEELPHIKIGLTVGGINDTLVLLRTLFPRLRMFKPDLIVAEDISFMPNCLTVWAYSKISKVPYLIRGLGIIPNKRPSKIRLILEPLISLFRGGARAFLCYSGHAANYYSSRYEKPCYVLCNSTLPAHTNTELLEIESSVVDKYSNANLFRIVFIGRLLPQKQVDLLLRVVTRLNCHLDILGDGPSKVGLERLSVELGITDKVLFHGQITDNTLKKDIFKQAHLGVLPGRGGLAIQEMMWYGIPVITSYADGTEMDLVVDGETGFFIKEMSENTLLDSIAKFEKLPCVEKTRIASNSYKVIDSKYNIDSMVSVYTKGIQENI